MTLSYHLIALEMMDFFVNNLVFKVKNCQFSG